MPLFAVLVLVAADLQHEFGQEGPSPASPVNLEDPFDFPYERTESSVSGTLEDLRWRFQKTPLPRLVVLGAVYAVLESANHLLTTAPESPRPPPIA